MQSGLHNPVFQINRSDKGDNELDPVGALAEVSRRPAPYLARVRSDGAKRVQSSISTAIRVAFIIPRSVQNSLPDAARQELLVIQ